MLRFLKQTFRPEPSQLAVDIAASLAAGDGWTLARCGMERASGIYIVSYFKDHAAVEAGAYASIALTRTDQKLIARALRDAMARAALALLAVKA